MSGSHSIGFCPGNAWTACRDVFGRRKNEPGSWFVPGALGACSRVGPIANPSYFGVDHVAFDSSPQRPRGRSLRLRTGAIVFVATSLLLASSAFSQGRLGDICRVKGQEENTLHGLGLAVGLNGTGDANLKSTQRALATMMHLMGNPVGQDAKNQELLNELKDARNVALVFVTCTVPAAGARQGDKLDCQISAIGAKSLAGGILMLTPLLGPRPGSQRVYAFAQGAIELDDSSLPATGRIHRGCRLEESFVNEFIADGKITLVLDKNHAGFRMAQDIVDSINSYISATQDDGLAKALDQVNIEIRIPKLHQEDPVLFVSDILNQTISYPQSEARVVINQRTGNVVIGADVEIGPVAISHKNFAVEVGGEAGNTLISLDPQQRGATKLSTLVDTLNAVHVPTQDLIEILKGIDRNGRLYGRLIID